MYIIIFTLFRVWILWKPLNHNTAMEKYFIQKTTEQWFVMKVVQWHYHQKPLTILVFERFKYYLIKGGINIDIGETKLCRAISATLFFLYRNNSFFNNGWQKSISLTSCAWQGLYKTCNVLTITNNACTVRTFCLELFYV